MINIVFAVHYITYPTYIIIYLGISDTLVDNYNGIMYNKITELYRTMSSDHNDQLKLEPFIHQVSYLRRISFLKVIL